jgi:hypothetical protein
LQIVAAFIFEEVHWSQTRRTGDESWKARVGEPEASVQARTVGIIAPGVDRAGPTRHRTIARAWKGLSLGFWGAEISLDIYELLNSGRLSKTLVLENRGK